MDKDFEAWWGQYTAPATQTGVVRLAGAVEAAFIAGREVGLLKALAAQKQTPPKNTSHES